MLDFLQRFATRIAFLRYVAIAAGLLCLVTLVVVVLGHPASGSGNRYLMPAIVGFIWCLSAYGFIDTFQSIPEKVEPCHGFFARIKRRMVRAWFWILAAFFGISTLAALFLTVKLGSFWLGKYYG